MINITRLEIGVYEVNVSVNDTSNNIEIWYDYINDLWSFKYKAGNIAKIVGWINEK